MYKEPLKAWLLCLHCGSLRNANEPARIVVERTLKQCASTCGQHLNVGGRVCQYEKGAAVNRKALWDSEARKVYKQCSLQSSSSVLQLPVTWDCTSQSYDISLL